MTIPRPISDSEDRPSDAELILYELRRANFEPDWHLVEPKPLPRPPGGAPDVILADSPTAV